MFRVGVIVFERSLQGIVKRRLTVTRNWRITFRIDTEEAQIVDLNYEDYH